MRNISRIVVGCTETYSTQDFDFDIINVLDEKEGIKEHEGIHCRWHYLILRNGRVQQGRAEHQSGAFLDRYNNDSIGIALVGGLDFTGYLSNNYTQKQLDALVQLVKQLKEYYPEVPCVALGSLPKSDGISPCFDLDRLLKEYNV